MVGVLVFLVVRGVLFLNKPVPVPLQETVVDEAFIEAMAEERFGTPGQGMVAKASENFPYFCEKMLGLKLYSWQVYAWKKIKHALLEKDADKRGKLMRQLLLLTGRQQGKSTFDAAVALWACVFNRLPSGIGNSTQVIIVSATEKQAMELLDKVNELIIVGDSFMEATYLDENGEPLFGKRSNKFRGFFSSFLASGAGNSASEITFRAHDVAIHGEYFLAGSRLGSVLKSYPPTKKILGQTCSLLIEDECGCADDITDDFHYKYASPTGDAYNAVRLYTSTPWVPRGFFYDLADTDGLNPNPNIERVMFTCESIRLENPRQYTTIQERVNEMRSIGQNDAVLLSYYCRFVKGTASYFDPDMVKKMFTDSYPMFDAYQGLCDMGIDFGGQTKSHTTITIARCVPDTGRKQRLYHRRYPIREDMSLIDDVADLLKRFNVQRIIPDDSPAGWHLIRVMTDKGWNVHPMNFKTDKIKKYGAFRSALNRSLVDSYVDDDLKKEMLAMEFSQGKQSTQIQHADGSTDDLIDGLVMALYFFLNDEDNRVRFVTLDWNDEKQKI